MYLPLSSLSKALAANIGFGVIGAGRFYLHQQQHGSGCSGWTFFNLAFSC